MAHPSLQGVCNKLIDMYDNYELFGSNQTPAYVDNSTSNATTYNYNYEYYSGW